MSMSSTFFPAEASWQERLTVRSVFPTPPFWLATAIILVNAPVVAEPERALLRGAFSRVVIVNDYHNVTRGALDIRAEVISFLAKGQFPSTTLDGPPSGVSCS